MSPSAANLRRVPSLASVPIKLLPKVGLCLDSPTASIDRRFELGVGEWERSRIVERLKDSAMEQKRHPRSAFIDDRYEKIKELD